MNGRVIPVKKRRWAGRRPADPQVRALCLLGGCFFLGSLLGCLLSARTRGSEAALTAYLNQYLEAARAGAVGAPGVLAALWDVVRYPLACMALSFLPSGRWMIPGVMAVRGFFLSFAVSAFVRCFGRGGLLLAAGAFLPAALGALPCMLAWGVRCRCAPEETAGSLRAALPLFGLCAGILLCAVVYECCFAPAVLGALAPSIAA